MEKISNLYGVAFLAAGKGHDEIDTEYFGDEEDYETPFSRYWIGNAPEQEAKVRQTLPTIPHLLLGLVIFDWDLD